MYPNPNERLHGKRSHLAAVGVLAACLSAEQAGGVEQQSNGLHGYISYSLSQAPAGSGFSAGFGFYSAVWPVVAQPLADMQIGMPGIWITPDNSDDVDTPLAPVGTQSRTWPAWGPTWSGVFQTIEGSSGYWAGNHFRYGPPKFSMNGTPQCYDYEVASPGWSFFYDNQALPDNRLGIAQLSNRLLIPPDALTYQGNPNGQFLGYSWMALPLTDASAGTPPTGDQSWTCFLNTTNFKGPIAYYVPETWSKIGQLFSYTYDYGRGLDARPGMIGGGAIEIGLMPRLEAQDTSGAVYAKIPALQFPVDDSGRTILVRDVTFYSKTALFDNFRTWANGGAVCSGIFNAAGAWKSTISTYTPSYDQAGEAIAGVTSSVQPQVVGDNTWGLQWSENTVSSKGVFPQYYKEVAGNRVAVAPTDVPNATGLQNAQFAMAGQGVPYTSPGSGAWSTPGPGSDTIYTANLADDTVVSYKWYRFVDQPAFQQYAWSAAKRADLQALVEKIHAGWPITRDYMPPPSNGILVTLDPALLVTPPAGMEVGYVPIVVRQELRGTTYRYYKFAVTASQGADWKQIGEMHYYRNGVWLPANNGSATQGTWSKANDNNCDGTKLEGPASIYSLTYDFGAPTTIDAYNWATGNDSAQVQNRSPKNWTVQGSNDNSTWTTLDIQANYYNLNLNDTWAAADGLPAHFNAFTTADSSGAQYAFPLAVPKALAVAITSPVDSAIVSPTFTLSATATVRPGTVTSVEFFDGDTSLGTSATSPYSLNVTGASVGTHQFKAVAQGNGGPLSSTVVNATVVAPPAQDNYRYYRFSVTANQGDSWNQMGEMHYYRNSVWIPATTGWASQGGWSNANDNNCGGTKLEGGSSTYSLTYDFGTAIAFDAYNWATANDSAQAPNRSPKSWTVQGSNDNYSWKTLDNQTNYYNINLNNTWAAADGLPAHFNTFTTSTSSGAPYAFPLLSPASYTHWANANAPGQSPDQDADHDGVQNGVEYFMGASGSSRTPNPGLDANRTITWPMSATFSGDYQIETSTDLKTWTQLTPKPLPVNGKLTYTPPSGAPEHFVRLVVTPN